MKKAQKTILVVDDSVLIINRIAEMLTELEMVNAVENALGYTDALKLLSEKKLTLLF